MTEIGQVSDVRYYCALSPCVPPEMGFVGGVMALGPGFPTLEAYHRHLEKGHFYTPGTPGTEPYVVTRMPRGG